MERKNFDTLLKENPDYARIQGCKNSVVYNLKNGEYLKLVNRKLLGIINSTGYSLETRLEAAEALRKLEAGISRFNIPGTAGIVKFMDYYHSETYPGLGSVKKLSLMHHLELMGHFLDEVK